MLVLLQLDKITASAVENDAVWNMALVGHQLVYLFYLGVLLFHFHGLEPHAVIQVVLMRTAARNIVLVDHAPAECTFICLLYAMVVHKETIERFRELQAILVQDASLRVDCKHNGYACSLENPANGLRVASTHKD